MSKQNKLEARVRIAQILSAALDLAPSKGYTRLTREEIAKRAGCPPSLIAYHLGTMASLRRQIMREAVTQECLPVIAQGLSMGDPHALKAPHHLRLRALSSIVGNA